MHIKIQGLTIRQKERILFKDFNLELNDKEIIGIHAPTGTGKTTFLNWIAGIQPQGDSIAIDGIMESSEPYSVSYIFQESRLLPSVTVLRNVSLPLEKIMGKAKAEQKAREMLEKLLLEGKIDSMPEKLSGGEKQRVAIARAFVFPGKLLLMDEPFHSQDDEKRMILLDLTKRIIEEENRIAIIVSHNKTDFEALGCRIITAKDFTENFKT